MKTTVELPDSLFRRAKAAAALRGISLREFFTESLERRLSATDVRASGPAWKKLHGGLARLRRETGRIQGAIDAEFEHVDVEDGE